jgi:hypothetical protein
MNGRVMARVRFNKYVSVCGFAVYLGGEFAIGGASDVDIQECDAAVDLWFPCELNTWVYAVKDFVEGLSRVSVIVTAPEARAAGSVVEYEGPTVIHVQMDVARCGEIIVSRFFYRKFHGVNHPKLGHRNHKRKPDRSTVISGVVAVIVNKVS